MNTLTLLLPRSAPWQAAGCEASLLSGKGRQLLRISSSPAQCWGWWRLRSCPPRHWGAHTHANTQTLLHLRFNRSHKLLHSLTFKMRQLEFIIVWNFISTSFEQERPIRSFYENMFCEDSLPDYKTYLVSFVFGILYRRKASAFLITVKPNRLRRVFNKNKHAARTYWRSNELNSIISNGVFLLTWPIDFLQMQLPVIFYTGCSCTNDL